MKVLFLSVTTGQGHHQAAKSVISYLEEQGVDTMLLDTFEYINPILSESIARGYLISTRFTPTMYGKLYRLAERKEKSETPYSISKLINAILSKKMEVYLKEISPDVIVCTHLFAAQIITHLRQKGLPGVTIGVVTDFTIHPFWEDTNLDYYITASSLLNLQAVKKGIPTAKIKPFGIPVHPKFAGRLNQSEARRILGLEDQTTVFVMSGSMGYGNVVNIIRQIDELDLDFQIISACGNNKQLKQEIDSLKTKKKIKNFGFAENVDVFMDAATCIITKPGGLTISESLAKCLPMILINPIPGQEDRNVEFLLNNGLAIKTSETYPVDEALFQLLSSDWRQEQLKKGIYHEGKPTSSIDLGNFIIEVGTGGK